MKMIPLEKLADIQLGKMLSPVAKTGKAYYPYLRNQNIQWHRIELGDLAKMDFSAEDRIKFELKAGDLLVCEGGEPGRCAIWRGELTDCYYQKAIHRVRPIEGKADGEFLCFWLWFQCKFRNKPGEDARTTIAHLPLGRLKQFPVPDISLNDQHRIVTILKPKLMEVGLAHGAVLAQLDEVGALARRLREDAQNDLRDAEQVPLADLLVRIDAGRSFQTADRLASDNELGVLKVSAVSWGEFKPNEAKAINGDYIPDERHRVREGDVIISRANTVELAGAVVRVDRDYPNRLLSDKTLRVVLDERQCDPNYIVQILRLPEARAYLEANATGTSDSMRNVTQDTIRAVPIPLPDMKEQELFATRLQCADRAIKSLHDASQVQLRELAFLPERLLSEVFGS